MKNKRAQKALNLLLTFVLLLTSFSVAVLAENDAADLGYKLQITITDETGTARNEYQIGETIHIKLSLTYTGAGKAPVYGLQGQLYFDPYVIKNTAFNEKNSVNMKAFGGVINYVFLDMTGDGRSDAMLKNIGEAKFIAKSNGKVSVYGDQFIVTNKDATGRYIDTSVAVTLTVGTGVKEVTKEALEADIAAAEKILGEATISDQNIKGIFYPDFWFKTQTAEALQGAIDEVKLVLEESDATTEEIEGAITKLDIAVKNFLASKIFGPRRFSEESDVATVKATVQGGNGKIAAGFESQQCRLNTSCTIRMQPNEGYETEYVTVNGENFLGSDIFTIPMVTRDTTVVVTFCKKPPFQDIANTDWFYVSARYVYNNGLFKGVTETAFSPESPMSRAMLATVLYRIEKEPAVSFEEAFTDVGNNLWYTSPILWASQNQIVMGNGNGKFAPDDFITREQIALMLHRYAKGKSLKIEETNTTRSFTDAAQISDYAIESINWAVATGLMQGNTETTINPQGIATRAEVATMLMRFMNLVKK